VAVKSGGARLARGAPFFPIPKNPPMTATATDRRGRLANKLAHGLVRGNLPAEQQEAIASELISTAPRELLDELGGLFARKSCVKALMWQLPDGQHRDDVKRELAGLLASIADVERRHQPKEGPVMDEKLLQTMELVDCLTNRMAELEGTIARILRMLELSQEHAGSIEESMRRVEKKDFNYR